MFRAALSESALPPRSLSTTIRLGWVSDRKVRRTGALGRSWRDAQGCSARAKAPISRSTVSSSEPSETTTTSNSGNCRASSDWTLETMLTSSLWAGTRIDTGLYTSRSSRSRSDPWENSRAKTTTIARSPMQENSAYRMLRLEK